MPRTSRPSRAGTAVPQPTSAAGHHRHRSPVARTECCHTYRLAVTARMRTTGEQLITVSVAVASRPPLVALGGRPGKATGRPPDALLFPAPAGGSSGTATSAVTTSTRRPNGPACRTSRRTGCGTPRRRQFRRRRDRRRRAADARAQQPDGHARRLQPPVRRRPRHGRGAAARHQDQLWCGPGAD